MEEPSSRKPARKIPQFIDFYTFLSLSLILDYSRNIDVKSPNFTYFIYFVIEV